MQLFEWILVLLVAAVLLSALARRFRMPYPAVLALLGCTLVFLPGAPTFVLQPQLALALFVAPILVDAAFDTSPRELLAAWKPILGLVIGAVGVTTIAVAFTARALVPELPWAAAIALGAIVAPPDAAAATAVLRSTPPPYRLVKLLEGESLFNDATALLIYRFAVSLAMGESIDATHAVPMLGFALVGSVALGWLASRITPPIVARIHDAPTSIVIQFATTFGLWLLAERLELSGILTSVTFAIAIARRSNMPAALRVPSYAFWETAVFVLNALAFVLIGLQLGPIVTHLTDDQRRHYGVVAVAVLATTIVVRFVWIALMRWWRRASFKEGLLVSWCGMRGIVTLAAAIGLPDEFPLRPLILVVAFTVVLGSLVLQGLTLRPLLALLDLGDDRIVEREVDVARAEALQSALITFDHDTSNEATALRLELAEFARDGHDPSHSTARLADLRRVAIVAARERLRELRATDRIGDDAFHRVEFELDRGEAYSDVVGTRRGIA